MIGERRRLVGRGVEGDRQPPTWIDGAAQHLGDRLPAFLSGIPGFQYRVCLPSVLTQRHRRAALEDDYHRLAGGFERVQQITLRFGQGDAGTVATIEPWHLEQLGRASCRERVCQYG